MCGMVFALVETYATRHFRNVDLYHFLWLCESDHFFL